MADDPDQAIPDDHLLLRGVPPESWNFDENRPRTAALISQELSVDWSKMRTTDEFMERQDRKARGHGLITFQAGLPRSHKLTVRYYPNPPYEPDNDAHTLVLGKSKPFGKSVTDPKLVEIVHSAAKPLDS